MLWSCYYIFVIIIGRNKIKNEAYSSICLKAYASPGQNALFPDFALLENGVMIPLYGYTWLEEKGLEKDREQKKQE